jgi:hypothetical protein
MDERDGWIHSVDDRFNKLVAGLEDLKKTAKWPDKECIGQIDQCIREIHEQQARFHRAVDQFDTVETYPVQCSGRMENPPQVREERPEGDELNTSLYRGRVH